VHTETNEKIAITEPVPTYGFLHAQREIIFHRLVFAFFISPFLANLQYDYLQQK